MQTLSSDLNTIVSALTGVFDNFYDFVKPFLDIAEGASKLLGMFQ